VVAEGDGAADMVADGGYEEQPVWHGNGTWPSRTLSLTLVRVEVRMYRRTRTSIDVNREPPRFEYVVRCCWTGTPMPRRPRISASPATSPRSTSPSFSPRLSPRPQNWGPGASGWWWDHLPDTYLVKRSWHELMKLHQAITTELAFDRKNGCRRVKAHLPGLPTKGDLHEFLLGVAATGDVSALSRSGRFSLANMSMDYNTPHSDLDGLHTIYAENRLGPYFAAINDVLSELPAEAMQDSQSLCRFCTYGVRSTARADRRVVPRRYMGPNPLLGSSADAAAVARYLREKGSLPQPINKSASDPSLDRRRLPLLTR